MAKKIHELPQTKGKFQFKGVISGTKSEKFYKETITKKTKKPFRMLNVGVITSPNAHQFVNLSESEKQDVYFGKRIEENGVKKNVTEKVKWKDRFTFDKEGFKLIGVNVGVTKTLKEGKNGAKVEVNDKKNLTPYDATKEIADNIEDGQSVFVKGSLEFSSYEKNNSVERSVKFIPSQFSLCQDVDFEDENFTPVAMFEQVIVFDSIEQDKDDNGKPIEDRYVLQAKIVNYNSIEPAEFIVINKAIAGNFKKNLKKYNAIKVWGNVEVIENTEDVSETDVWGSENEMTKVNSKTRRELVVTGADPSTIEKETYTEESMAKAIAAINADKQADKDFGDSAWGSVKSDVSGFEDDDDVPW